MLDFKDLTYIVAIAKYQNITKEIGRASCRERVWTWV